MEEFTQIESLREYLAGLRGQGEAIAFVPTMGNLHEGHLELVREAKRKASVVVVSIYVNPTQFGEGEDFEDYPRTLQQDRKRLEDIGVSILFSPSDAEMYPNGGGFLDTKVEVAEISEQLCGRSRPGHFAGVATVVTKLLNIVQPDVALFGQKDYQQLLVIRRLVADLNLPVEVVGVPTFREDDGLAMSSRNGYLDLRERKKAPGIYRTLQWAGDQIESGREDYSMIEQEAREKLLQGGFSVDYFSILDSRLHSIDDDSRSLIILVAANMGTTRLIDNLPINLR